MPPDDDAELEAATLDADKLVAEVESTEGAASADDDTEGDANLSAPLPSFNAEDDSGIETVLPSMEGMSILRETELNDVINDV